MNEDTKAVIEFKSIENGLHDVDKTKRVMVGLFSPYGTPDMIGDVAHKGMFEKTWKENKSRVTHLFEHDTLKVIARNPELWEDDNGAYYKSIVPKHKLGDDVLDLAVNGLITGHSYAYAVVKGNKNSHGGRDLKEVKHFEVTSTGGAWAVHPKTPLLYASKSLPIDGVVNDLETRYSELESRWYELLEKRSCKAQLEKFCRTSNATDETIIYLESLAKDYEEHNNSLLLEIKQLHQNIIDLSMINTQAASKALEPPKGVLIDFKSVRAAIEIHKFL